MRGSEIANASTYDDRTGPSRATKKIVWFQIDQTFRGLQTLCLATVADARAAKRHLTLEDYLNFERVTDPQISADGERILYTRRWVDNVNDRWSSAI